jgi:hypothetical protein
MDLTSDTIQKLLDVAAPATFQVTDVHGTTTTFCNRDLKQVKAAAPELPQAVDVATLAGFADLVKAQLEGLDFPADFLIQVEDERTVTLKARISDGYGRRLVLVKAAPVPFQQFAFGTWLSQEEFAIMLASRFAETPDKAYVLNMASILTNDAATSSEDDGFTQRVNVKAGLRMKEATTLKPRVDLAPYRTFPEVAQPVSSFVLRAKCDGENRPFLTLVEADGGRWKVVAIATLRQVLEAFGLGIPIIA